MTTLPVSIKWLAWIGRHCESSIGPGQCHCCTVMKHYKVTLNTAYSYINAGSVLYKKGWVDYSMTYIYNRLLQGSGLASRGKYCAPCLTEIKNMYFSFRPKYKTKTILIMRHFFLSSKIETKTEPIDILLLEFSADARRSWRSRFPVICSERRLLL